MKAGYDDAVLEHLRAIRAELVRMGEWLQAMHGEMKAMNDDLAGHLKRMNERDLTTSS